MLCATVIIVHTVALSRILVLLILEQCQNYVSRHRMADMPQPLCTTVTFLPYLCQQDKQS